MFKKTTRRSNGATKKVIVLIVLALFVALLMPTPGRAQVIEVPCQFSATLPLALAIDEANGSPGPDTIRLESGCTYGLFGTYVYDEGHNGLPTIYETLTIEGNGARLERTGNPNIRYRLLKASSHAALTIKDLTLANGYAYDPNNENVQGGAIHTTGDLTLNNVAIVNNVAGGSGGGVFAAGDNVTISGSHIDGNQSLNGSGGGLFVEGADFFLYSDTFFSNQAEQNGGGAYFTASEGSIFESRFEGNQINGNSAYAAGGGLFAGSDLSLHYSEFIDNRVPNGSGGALYVYGRTTVTDTRFENNFAHEGGAIYADYAKATVERSTFLNNEAATNGAGIYLFTASNVTSIIGNSLLVGNHSSHGSTIYVTAAFGDLTNLAVIYHNTLADPGASDETAIDVQQGTAQIVNNIAANYTTGLENRFGSVSAGHNLYEIADPTEVQVGPIMPFGNGSILTANPRFVDRGAGNYRLQANSLAIDRGYETSVIADIEGTKRPQGNGYDLGAYEAVTQNSPPSSADDAYTTLEDTPLTVPAPGVLDNDFDPDGDTLTAVLEDSPQNGSVVLNGDGSFTYTPDSGYDGEDSFTYRADDGQASSNVATVTIEVENVNQAPTAADDAYMTLIDTTLIIAAPGVLDNDDDADGDGLTAAVDSPPTNGTVILKADGSFSYTPDGGYVGQDSFTYRASDGEASSNVATVTISIEAANTNVPPVALGDTYQTDANTTLTVPAPGVLENDSDVNGDSLTAVLVAGPDYGLLTFDSDGGFAYTPDNGYAGEDTFTYRAQDGVNASNEATVLIQVLPGYEPTDVIFLPMFLK